MQLGTSAAATTSQELIVAVRSMLVVPAASRCVLTASQKQLSLLLCREYTLNFSLREADSSRVKLHIANQARQEVRLGIYSTTKLEMLSINKLKTDKLQNNLTL